MLLHGEALDEESCECCVNANLSHLDYRIVAKEAAGLPHHAASGLRAGSCQSSRRLGADLHLLRHHFTLNVVGQGIVDAHVNEAPDQLFRTWKMNQLVRARAAG